MNQHEFWNEDSNHYFQINKKELKFTALHPRILDMVKPKGCKKILDFGCGAGILASQIAQTADVTVLGVDVSEQAIEQARQVYQSQSNLRFECITSSDDEILKDMAPFDVAIVSLVTGNLPNKETARLLFKHLFEYISPNGHLIVGESHPCFKSATFTTTSFNLSTEDYSQDWVPHQIELFNAITGKKEVGFPAFYYSLETVVKLICQAGFFISDMEEIYDIDDPEYHPEIRKRFNAHLPHFLLIEAMKPNFETKHPAA